MNKNVVKYKQFFEFSRHSPGLNLTLLEFYITVCILVNQYQNDIDFSLFLKLRRKENHPYYLSKCCSHVRFAIFVFVSRGNNRYSYRDRCLLDYKQAFVDSTVISARDHNAISLRYMHMNNSGCKS